MAPPERRSFASDFRYRPSPRALSADRAPSSCFLTARVRNSSCAAFSLHRSVFALRDALFFAGLEDFFADAFFAPREAAFFDGAFLPQASSSQLFAGAFLAPDFSLPASLRRPSSLQVSSLRISSPLWTEARMPFRRCRSRRR